MVIFTEQEINFQVASKAIWYGLLAGSSAGFIGYLIGRTLEASGRRSSRRSSSSDLFVDDIKLDDIEDTGEMDDAQKGK